MRGKLHRAHSNKLVGTNIHKPLGPRDRYALSQEHTYYAPGHTNYTLTGFTDGRGDRVYWIILVPKAFNPHSVCWIVVDGALSVRGKKKKKTTFSDHFCAV